MLRARRIINTRKHRKKKRYFSFRSTAERCFMRGAPRIIPFVLYVKLPSDLMGFI